MPKYTVRAYREYVGYDKVYLGVEANSKEEALEFAKADPDIQEWEDCKNISVESGEWQDKDGWEVLND